MARIRSKQEHFLLNYIILDQLLPMTASGHKMCFQAYTD